MNGAAAALSLKRTSLPIARHILAVRTALKVHELELLYEDADCL